MVLRGGEGEMRLGSVFFFSVSYSLMRGFR